MEVKVHECESQPIPAIREPLLTGISVCKPLVLSVGNHLQLAQLARFSSWSESSYTS